MLRGAAGSLSLRDRPISQGGHWSLVTVAQMLSCMDHLVPVIQGSPTRPLKTFRMVLGRDQTADLVV